MLKPKSVIGKYKLLGTIDGGWALNATRDYIWFEGGLGELFEKMRRKVLDRTWHFIL